MDYSSAREGKPRVQVGKEFRRHRRHDGEHAATDDDVEEAENEGGSRGKGSRGTEKRARATEIKLTRREPGDTPETSISNQ